MKNFKFLLLSFSIIIGLVSHSQTDPLTYRFNNYAVIPGTTNDTLVFDLEIQSSTPGTYLVGFQADVIFNENAFGTDAQPVEWNRLALVSNAVVYTNLPFGNPATNKFRHAITNISFTGYDPSVLSLVPTGTWGPLVQYKLLIVDNSYPAGIQLDLGAMTGQSFYVMVYTPWPNPALQYDPILADNDLLGLPLYPTVFDLFISEVADPETPDAYAKFVEIYNPSPYPVDFNWYNWTISRQANGGSWADASLTTGVIGAMSTFVVAYQQAAFFTAYGFDADLYSGNISGNGDDSYALMKGDGYTGGGTLIDIYGVIDVDGTGEIWEYKDTKAVRHWDVTAPNPTWTYSEWAIGPRNLNAVGSVPLVAYGADMTPKSHKETFTWTGAAKSSDWRDKGNWDLGYIPDAATDVVLNASPGPTVGATAYAYCHDINIASGTGDGLLIESYNDGSTDGSIITYGTVTGLTTVQRNLSADVWHYVSMPVGSEFAMVFYHCFLRKYDEAAGDWVAWIVPETTPLDVMDGYAVWAPTGNPLFITTDTTTQYIGTLNSGAQNTALTRVTDGFNFTGNPYQSSLDWDGLGWDKAALETDAYYVWNDTSYASYVGGVGTNDATRFIPQQQGFFVKAATGGGNFGMDNLSRTHSVSSFMKDTPVFADLLRLTISNAEYADEIVIRFNENATTGIDFNYDAHKFFAWVSPQLFTMSETHKMAINALNNTTQSPAVNMGFTIPESGEYTITASNIESFLNTPIFLEDIKESKIINLRESSSYTFSATTQEDPMRFIVHFTDQLGIDDPDNADVNNIYAFNKDVYVNFTGQNGVIFIYNVMGQRVYQGVASNGLNKITLEKGNAAYIVKVISDNTIVSEKVFLR